MTSHFDLITIGGGSGGIAASRRAAAHGARVAVIEKSRLGGTCVMRGCVPKKLLMYASQFRDTLDIAQAYGWSIGDSHFDMNAWQEAKTSELHRLEDIYRSMLRKAQVEVIEGVAEILSPQRVRVGAVEYSCERLLIATGGSPSTAPIPGLELALTSDDLLELRSVPKRLAVIGAGYIGIEFSSMLARLGSEVSVFFRGELALKGFDADLRLHITEALRQAGVNFLSATVPLSITQGEHGYLLQMKNGESLAFDAVLNATGRDPNTGHLGLEKIGVTLDAGAAIPVNEYSETVVPNVYAIGDVTNRKNLTPVAIAEGRAFADTVFGKSDIPVRHDQVATAIFTDPPMATVGLTEAEAAAVGAIVVYATSFRPMRTAFAQRQERTYMKLVVSAENDRVLGIHMLGPDAPEIVQSLAVALRANVTKRQFDQTLAVHPTNAEEFVLLREPVRAAAQK